MSDSVRERRARPLLADVSRVVPGLYAWLATVLAPCLQRGAPLSARSFAGLALLALLGSLALPAQGRLGRVLGVYGFLACCFGAWAGLGPRLRSDQLDAVRGGLGALGFLLHALAWGAAPKQLDAAGSDNLVPGAPLQPRHKPMRMGLPVLCVGVVAGLLPMGFAFGVQSPAASLLAHALAVGSGLLVIAASAEVALRVGKPHRAQPWRTRALGALWAVGGLVAAGGVALLWLALR